MANAENKSDALVELHKEDEKNDQTVTDFSSSVEKKKRNRKTNNDSISKINHLSLVSIEETEKEITVHTPRRSTRKSVKPVQDYEEIVCTRTLRSAAKKIDLEGTIPEEKEPEQRWTPAKVGRVSQKRGKRSKRVSKFTLDDDHEKIDTESHTSGDLAKSPSVTLMINDKLIKSFDYQPSLENSDTHVENKMEGRTSTEKDSQCKSSGDEINCEEQIMDCRDNFLINKKAMVKLDDGLEATNIKDEAQILHSFIKETFDTVNEEEMDIEKNIILKANTKKDERTPVVEDISTIKNHCKTFEVELENTEDTILDANKRKDEDQTLDIGNTSIKKTNNNTFEVEAAIEKVTIMEADKEKDEEQTLDIGNTSTKKTLDNTFEVETEIEKDTILDANNVKDGKQTLDIGNMSAKQILDCTFEVEAEADKNTVLEAHNEEEEKTVNIGNTSTTQNLDDTFEVQSEQNHDTKSKELNDVSHNVHSGRNSLLKPLKETVSVAISEVDDLGVMPLPQEHLEGSDDMPSLIFLDDDSDDSVVSIDENIDLVENGFTQTSGKENVLVEVTNIENEKGAKTKSNTNAENQVAFATPKASEKIRSKLIRVPTPYKAHSARKLLLSESKLLKTANDSTLEPSAIANRSTRRRSSSTSRLIVNRKRKAPGLGVSFCSPANQIIVIEDFDTMLAKRNKDEVDQLGGTGKTQIKDSHLNIGNRNLKLKVGVTPTKPRLTPSKVSVRTKLPNFAAIHQKQVDKMESIVDHVVRKMERAKDLTASTSKIASGKKDATSKLTTKEGIKSKTKPKAVKNINSELSKHTQLSEEDLHKIATLPRPAIPTDSPSMASNKSLIGAKGKPRPKIAPLHLVKKPVAEKVTRPAQQQQSKSQLREHNEPAEKKTAARSKNPVPTWEQPIVAQLAGSKIFSATTSESKATESVDSSGKLAARRERHMGMFKGRVDPNRSTNSVTQRNNDLIRGVRLNRRFNLQMQHRQNLDN